MDEAELISLARLVVEELVRSEALRGLVKEVALEAAAEQEKLRREGVPKAFIGYCTARDCYCWLSGGQVKVKRQDCRPLDSQVLHILSLYREEIRAFLKAHPGQQRKPPTPAPNGLPQARKP